MVTIDLTQRWILGALLHEGGFGRVFAAEAEDGSAVAVKLVPKEPGASRELLFEPLSGLPNIIPVLDLGEWSDSYVIVMPLAATSLRRYLADAGGRLAQDEVLTILADVAETLVSLNQAGVVHTAPCARVDHSVKLSA
jgi:serine/threonine-protein kinase